jgi:nitroreductase
MWEPDRAKQVLGIPPEHHFEVALSFGYPAQPTQASPVQNRGRRPLDEIVHWETW